MHTLNITSPENGQPEKLYDLCMIEKLCRGNTEQIKQMINVFIDKMPGNVKEIKEAYTKNDGPAIKKAAHKIKPVLGMYAVVKIEKEIRDIELLGNEGAMTIELANKIEMLDHVIMQIVEEMKKTFLYQ